MRNLLPISFIASMVLTGQSFANFGATSVYNTDGLNLGYSKMVNIHDNSLLFYANSKVKVVDLTNSSENTIFSTINLSKGVEVMSDDGDFLIKDYKNNYYYDFHHYDSSGNKIDDFINVLSDEIIEYNNGNIITSDNFVDGTLHIHTADIISTNSDGTQNFVVELNGTVESSKFSMDSSSIFATTSHYYNDGERFYILDSSTGNIILDKDISDVNTNSFFNSGSSVYLVDATNKDVFSYNTTTGGLNWTSYTLYSYKPSISLIRDDSTLMLTYEQYPSYFELLNASTGLYGCKLYGGAVSGEYSYDKNSDLIVADITSITGDNKKILKFVNPTNCSVEYEENYINSSMDGYRYISSESKDVEVLNYIPILKDSNQDNTVEFLRYEANGTLLSTTTLGENAICATRFVRTKENNFFFLTDNKATVFNKYGDKIAEVDVNDTTDCYYSREFVADGNKFAIRTGNGSLNAYELNVSVGKPTIPIDTTTINLDSYLDITLVGGSGSTTTTESEGSILTLNSASTNVSKNKLINLSITKTNVSNVVLSVSDNSVELDSTSDIVKAKFSKVGQYTLTLSGNDLNGSAIQSALTFNVSNTTPISENGTISTNSNETLVINKSQYFYDEDGDNLSLEVSIYPDRGRVVIDGDKIIYKPEADTYSTNFSIKATDVDGAFTTASFDINTYQSTASVSLKDGWNLIGNSFVDKTINSNSLITEPDDVIWVYEDGVWSSSQSNSIEIKSKQGFWFYSNSINIVGDRELSLNATNNSDTLTPSESGWSLISSTVDTTLGKLHFGFKNIYFYDGTSWVDGLSTPEYEVAKFKGYWGEK